ncbi:MAG TPA: 23S rRNA (adenine(2503)-C(2))-methyltransferase RlmN [Rhabdochlamydiaceae bacterium]|nr:23S rRNA (adenine(2503)-C(2))-methyltransferase RlmN [Rhabdochlamydiaceae bacterium]
MIQLHEISLTDLKKWLEERGEKGFRAGQIFHWIYQRKITDWQAMTDLNKDLRALLSGNVKVSHLTKVQEQCSKDGETTKFLWELADGLLVESVLICSGDRRTVCVSSQVGCPARCAFCASGKEGLKRNLSAAEIFEQVYAIDQFLQPKGERVSHVVFMGMGEPLENYDNVVRTLKLLCDPDRLNFSQRRITVSTVGIVEGIRRLAEEGIKVNLVLSLHAPNQNVRKKIIPYARKYALEDILAAMLYYFNETGRDITYEYTLLSGINDGPEHARELASLLKGQQCTVNLIPFNPVEGLRLKRPEKEAIEEFRAILLGEDIVTTWRYTKGKDIAAACGQLALRERNASQQ